MAARTVTTSHKAEVRERIKTSQLLNRLQGNALGEIELTPVQQRSIEILLRKTLPDLSAISLSGDPDNPLQLTVVTGVPR